MASSESGDWLIDYGFWIILGLIILKAVLRVIADEINRKSK